MSQKVVIYCSANFTQSEGGTPISLAMVHPGGRWVYAEAADIEPETCDERARDVCLPVLRRIPGTNFVQAEKMAEMGSKFISMLNPCEVEDVVIRTASPSLSMHDFFFQVRKLTGQTVRLQVVDVNQENFVDFLRHCGGVEKTEGHALLHAVATALCDVNREVPTSFHEASIFHLELLLGSKNATSYRAWARAMERHWDALQQAAA